MIGDYLKKSRQAANLSLEDVSAATMIKLSYLKALEDEDFKALPCEVFTKGYIRVYLEFLNMDSSEGLRILQEDRVYPVKSPVKLNTSKYAGSIKIDNGETEQPAKQPISLPQTLSAITGSSTDYTRHLVYLIVFLAFLAVVVYSSSKLFSAAKEGNTAVTSSVGSGDNQALRNVPSDPSPGSAKNSEKTPVTVEKKAVSKIPDTKKTSKKPSDKVKESMNILNMSTAEASTPAQPQEPLNNKPELNDMSKAVQKMKAMTASLKSLKTAVEKAKSTGQKPTLDAGKSESPAAAPTPAEVKPTDVPIQTLEKPDVKTMASAAPALAGEKEINRSAVDAEAFSYGRESGAGGSSGTGAVDVLNMQLEEKTEKSELTVVGDTN